MRGILIFLLFFICIQSKSQKVELLDTTYKMDEIFGDLDKDGIDERVVVFKTNDSSDLGFARELQIQKLVAGRWKIWKSSKETILRNTEVGMINNPFFTMEIKNGILIINHDGGRSWKWRFTDKYRFQNNEFRLIGFQSVYGRPMVEWTIVDFNLITGKVILTKEYENDALTIVKAEKEMFYKKKINLTINNRFKKSIEIVSPKYGISFNL